MVFNGISKVFSTKDDRQYETIGAFWDEFSKKYGREKLRGLGYNWRQLIRLNMSSGLNPAT